MPIPASWGSCARSSADPLLSVRAHWQRSWSGVQRTELASRGARQGRADAVGRVGVESPLDRARRHAQRLAASDRLDRLQVPLVDGAPAYEPDETFTVTLFGVVGAPMAGSQGVGTITNDDSPPPPGTPVVWTSLVGVSASGNSLTKTADIGWGNAGAVSTSPPPTPFSSTRPSAPRTPPSRRPLSRECPSRRGLVGSGRRLAANAHGPQKPRQTSKAPDVRRSLRSPGSFPSGSRRASRSGSLRS